MQMIFDSPTSSPFIVRFHQNGMQDKAPRKDSQPSSTMRNWVMATLLALVVAVSAGVGYGVGYFVGSTSQSSTGRCTPVGSIGGSIPAGVDVTVSYQSDWRLAIAEFASNQTRASTLDSVCSYEGSGDTSFYVSIANYQGWNTVVAAAHKFGGAGGTLTVTVMFGGSSSTNSTTSAYGTATVSFSFLE